MENKLRFDKHAENIREKGAENQMPLQGKEIDCI